MSSFENIYMKMVPTLDATDFASRQQPGSAGESPAQIEGEVAHELNNILTIIQGYADQMIMKNGDNPALRAKLQLISDNTRRAVAVVRSASRSRSRETASVA